MGLLDNLKNSLEKATKKVVGQTVKAGAKAVKIAAKPVTSASKAAAKSNIPGLSQAGKAGVKASGNLESATSKAAAQAEAEAIRAITKASSISDQATNPVANIMNKLREQAQETGSQLKDTSKDALKSGATSLGDMGEGLAQGDFRKVGTGGLGLIDAAKQSSIGNFKSLLGANMGLLNAAGAGTGIDDLSKASQNIEREGTKGTDQYGGTAFDLGANYASGGTYGLAQSALGGLANGGLKGLANSKTLMQAGLNELGVPVTINDINSAQMASKGDLQGAALAQAGLQGINPKDLLNSLKTGDINSIINNPQLRQQALQQLTSLASSKASEYGIDPNLTQMGSGVLQGRSLQNAAIDQGSQYAGVDPSLMRSVANIAQGNNNLQSELMSQAGNQMGFGDFLNAAKGGNVKDILKNLSSSGMASKAIQQVVPEQYRGLANSALEGKVDPKQVLGIAGSQMLPAGYEALVNPDGSVNSKFAAQVAKNEGWPALKALIPSGSMFDNSAGEQSQEIANAVNNNKDVSIFDSLYGGIRGLFSSEPDNGRILNPEETQQEQQPEQSDGPSFLDQVKTGFGKIGSGLSSAGNYAINNPELISGLANVGGSLLSTKQQNDALKKQQDELSGQLAEARNMQAFEQSSPELYKQLAQGGPTSKYVQEMQKTARDAGTIAQSGRSAALERMARMGRGGGDLEAMLQGAQEGANRYSDASRDALSRDQDLRIGAQEKLSSIDQFNALQKQTAQNQRMTNVRDTQSMQMANNLQQGKLKANLTSGIAGAVSQGVNQIATNNRDNAKAQQVREDKRYEIDANRPQQEQILQPIQQQAQTAVKQSVKPILQNAAANIYDEYKRKSIIG